MSVGAPEPGAFRAGQTLDDRPPPEVQSLGGGGEDPGRLFRPHWIRKEAKTEVEIMTGSLLLRSRKAQTNALNEALDSLGAADEGGDVLSQEIRWLVEDCVRTSGRLKAAFDRGQRQWTPRPVEDIHEFYMEFLGIVDGQLGCTARVKDQALKVSEAKGESLDLDSLDESMASLHKLRENVAGLCEWLISPVSAPDEPFPSSAERRAAFERGEYEDAEDIYNRLRMGGPLLKE